MAGTLTFSGPPNSGTGTTPPGSSSTGTGNIFLDVLGTVANWDILRRTGLPNTVDGGSAMPVSDGQQQYTDRTPPAPPGGITGWRIGDITGQQLGIGAAALAGLAGLFLLMPLLRK